MGACCQLKSIHQVDYLEYHQKVSLKILQKDRKGNYKGYRLVTLELPPPIDQLQSIFSICSSKYRASGCALPGKDPEGEYSKDCQDSYTFTSKSNIFFSVLFDGHGKEGRKVSYFCRDFMENYFLSNPQYFEGDPKQKIAEMVKLCDENLNKSSIDCSLSGSTAVILVVNSAGIHVGSLGDSRAVLASIPKDNTGIPLPFSDMPYRRPVAPSRLLNALALTIDQKPNHEEELSRIRRSGGIVERVTNDMGLPIGPYRVWRRKGNTPGLAMSRSLGDRVAHEIGVISVPIMNSFELYEGFDQFAVIASDGIWDVMDNYEVINLVEKFRNRSSNIGCMYPARISNSTIARILCEEARYRWLGIVEEEDVMIDDISCVVLELGSVEPEVPGGSIGIADRELGKFKSIIVEAEIDIEDFILSRKDPTRGSMIECLEAFSIIKDSGQNIKKAKI